MNKINYLFTLVVLFNLACRNNQNHSNSSVQIDSLAVTNDRSTSVIGDSILKIAPEIPLDSISIDSWGNWKVFITQRSIDEKYIQTIDTSCAIIIYPSPIQMREYYNSLDSTKPDEGGMDDMYYRYENQQILDSLRIKTVVAERRFLRLKGKKEWLLDTYKRNVYFSMLILFAVNKEPQLADVLLDKVSVAEYFQIKH